MWKIRKRKIPNPIFNLGVAIIGIGGVMLTISFGFELGWVCAAGSGLIFAAGLGMFLSGCFDVYRTCKMVGKWDNKLIERALRSAPPDSKIRILQTWLPHHETFWPDVETLLQEQGKEFSFEILLMNVGKSDSPCDDLLDARILLRVQNRKQARACIQGNISHLIRMKKSVDTIWQEKHPGRELNLRIRFYKFMPFGPIFLIGKSYLFVGFYLNRDSSECAPMLVLRDPNSRIWKIFEKNFKHGWREEKGVKEVFFADRKILSREISRAEERKDSD